MNDWHLRQAVRVLRNGGIIAYPTEAVWGLGCDPFNSAAVQRLLEIKRRPEYKGLILAAASEEQIEPLLVHLSDQQRAQLSETWPGPNTWLLPDTEQLIPRWIKGQHSGVAVRVSAHPIVRALCEAFGAPLVSTSANVSSAPPAKSKTKVRAYFGSGVDFIVDGALGGLDRPTTIRNLSDNSVVRT
ncbi:TsaC protein (YrdC domain) required for threonylcarbamoyladenosine t(6)A37 modification in tRNA [Marinobacterium lacunae]|uniref:Threonylcarbamoyl-AMP synthase n=1 Tax=Marinobacterium lacunae TaxID=1232683 RepID=A0A081FVB9_9GAMM|nr:L-threonylcarbamoyladenylate synthase [Marinobacterium lacunae]KEA62474.1 TsaC protein (YrdC domain) required for threonylcarbamoyladenosine t(6)A37 modification in tRNA [Marinobacterium lacunae]MBR9882218.1 threonylcarbamoyl-AMP synthase [Oceanospirillales bacterium]